MFVFKAAVVGAGTMGGQIAQTIAAAGIPVVLKDVKQEFVDAGLTEARNVTAGPGRQLVEKGKLTEEQGNAQVEEIVGRIDGTTSYEGFGDVDFVIEAVPEKMEIKQAVFAELDAVDAGPRDPRLQHVVAVDHRDRRRDAAPRQGRRLPLLLPGVGHAADRDRRGRRDVARDDAGGDQLRPGDQEEPDHLRRGARASSSTASSTRASPRSGARRRSRASSIKKIDEAVGAANVAPMPPFFLIDLLGLDTVLHVAEHLQESYGDRFYVHKGMQKLVVRGQARREVRRRGLLHERRAEHRGRRRRRTARSSPRC